MKVQRLLVETAEGDALDALELGQRRVRYRYGDVGGAILGKAVGAGGDAGEGYAAQPLCFGDFERPSVAARQ